jgi:hypothetical protein
MTTVLIATARMVRLVVAVGSEPLSGMAPAAASLRISAKGASK